MKEGKGLLQLIAGISWFGACIALFWAMIGAFEIWWGVPGFISFFIALFLAACPIVGTIVGIMAVMEMWGWNLWVAISVFCWPYLFILVAYSYDGLSSIINNRRYSRPDTSEGYLRPHSDDPVSTVSSQRPF